MAAGKSLREQLAERSDMREKEVELAGLGLTVTIRRATVGERKRLLDQHHVGPNQPAADPEALGRDMMKLCVVPALTDEDINDMPSIVSDALSTVIMAFNGWSKQGVAELTDQFPAQ